MIRSNNFKYCVYHQGARRESLVDMKNDPGEMKNLADVQQYKNVLNEHRNYLKRWIKDSGDQEGKALLLDE